MVLLFQPCSDGFTGLARFFRGCLLLSLFFRVVVYRASLGLPTTSRHIGAGGGQCAEAKIQNCSFYLPKVGNIMPRLGETAR